jgi:drug/metabolite transporter (DMT)-like permease
MTLWVPVTVAAALFQTARTATQQRLRSLLSVSAAGFVRYAYGAPLALGAVAIMLATNRYALPLIPIRFWPIVAGAGGAQIMGTICLIRSFDARDFAIGTVFSKTEVASVSLFSTVFLGEPLRAAGWIAVVLCLAGVVMLAAKNGSAKTILRRFDDRSARFGIAAGALFAAAAVGIRAASQSLGTANPAVLRALITLAVMNSMQTLMHGTYLFLRERDQLVKSFVVWRSSSIVGVLSVLGSAGWAIAMTLQNAARVRTLGQVELLFTFAIAHFWLKERHTVREYFASALIVAGVVVIVTVG